MCKNVMVSGQTKEVRSYSQWEKGFLLYDSMLEIGKQSNNVMTKGASQINQTIKNYASEYLPSGDELGSCASD